MFKNRLQKAREVIENRQAVKETAKNFMIGKRNQETQALIARIREVAGALGIDEWVVYRQGVDYGVLFGYRVFYKDGEVHVNLNYESHADHYSYESKPLTVERLADRIAGYGHGGKSSVEFEGEVMAAGYQ